MKVKFLLLTILFIIQNSSFTSAQLQGQAKIDSLLKKLPLAKEDTNKVMLLYQLSMGMIQIQPDKALEYAISTLKLSEQIDWKIGIIKSYFVLSSVFQSKHDFNKSLEYYQKSLDLSKEINYTRGIAGNLHNVGKMHSKLNNNKLALEYIFKAIELNKKFGYNDFLSTNYRSISDIYSQQSNFDLAIEYSLTALNLNLKLGLKSEALICYANIAGLYWNQKKYEESLEYYFKSAELCYELDDKYKLALNFGNIGELYYEIAIDTNINFGKVVKLNRNKNFNLIKSKEYLIKTLHIYTELNNIDELVWYYNSIAKVFFQLEEYKNAYQNIEKSFTLKDSLSSIQGLLKYKSLESKLEFEGKQKEIEKQKHQIEKQKSQQLVMAIGLSSLVLIIFGLVFFFVKIKKQKSIIELQKSIVEEKNEQIVSSITYASTIQHAILPWESTLQKAFKDIFIFYKPKDIVSGDSYWFQEVDGIKFLAVIDCTGHGIPGSMLTVIASSVLDDAVLSKRLTDTGEILTYMNKKVTEVLNQRLKENEIRDGMELALIAVKENKIQFSGAGRPLYLKNGTFDVIKTDKRGIAGQTENDEYQFSSIEIEKSENLSLYLTSDGFADQMNEDSKKYSTKRFVSLLENISKKTISEQFYIIENEFNSHKGTRNQIDDVTILGLKL